MSKRRRTEFPVVTRSRPLAKELIAIAKDDVTSTQVVTVFLTATFPCTITGLRWDLNFLQDGGTGASAGHWCIAVVREGVTVDTLSLTDGATFFSPEANVMAFGVNLGQATPASTVNLKGASETGSTKTMRKLQTGDTLQWVFVGTTTHTQQVRGIIQFMCMS